MANEMDPKFDSWWETITTTTNKTPGSDVKDLCRLYYRCGLLDGFEHREEVVEAAVRAAIDEVLGQ